MITEMKAGHLKDIDKPSEPFEVIGKIIPRYENENWTFTELLYEAPYLKSYQDEEDEEDEEADCLEYIDNTDKIIYLYYQDDKCVGKVKLRKNWNRYAYIEDIAVCKDFRGQGIGSALINISIEWAKHKNLHGLMLETQDNNLIACKFYHNCGFKIGSVDTMLYANFENNFEKAVFQKLLVISYVCGSLCVYDVQTHEISFNVVPDRFGFSTDAGSTSLLYDGGDGCRKICNRI